MTSSATLEALNQPPSRAIAYFRDKLNVPTERWTDLMRGAHVRAFSVAGATSDALLNDFRRAVLKGLEQGTTQKEFRRDFDEIVARHGWKHTGTAARRAKLIYETNLNMAQAAGRYAEMTEPAALALYPYWQYVHSGSRHPRIQHLAWNGLILRADDPFWATHYPPNGWHCGCYVRAVSGADMRRMGRDGPDPTPSIVYRPWRNPRTGQVERVPAGIDPGFDYNPGRVWQQQVPPAAPAAVPAPPAPAAPKPPRPTAPSVVPHDYPSPQVADADLTDRTRRWADSLTPVEQEAVSAWKAVGPRINRTVRGEAADVLAARVAVSLDTALQRAVAPSPLRLHRGVAQAELDLYRARLGRTVRGKGFMATSVSRDVAAMFERDAMIEVLVPQGLRGAAYVSPWPTGGLGEYEMLLADRTAFRVFERDTDGMIVLEAFDDSDPDQD